ncbi:SusC/RagA family TonB-linked outer membrane protein [Prolixibacter bellariivorans]|uniref:SusC/RagA family TonB-linked outer membrane protein n=1 Tax=Prolixibacter bellariivorans TaxID=314319 RepID=A0A5M4ATC1_9BACT|nr:TonB-dependent receptor [Prolixibacter bellariivorans]GET31189.1 SusC/RagA family TonB-linked outer membrane protein [Prolixibacter bellariivorans]
MRNFALLITVLAISLQSLWAQTREISGVVTSGDDGSTIPGVSVSVKGTTLGTITDVDGKYTLNVPQDANALVFSFVGMKTVEVSLTTQTVYNVTMKSESVNVNEVVVTGYGVKKKAAFTGAASTLDQQKITDRTNPSPIAALSGNVAGLQMSTGSGQPGAPATIYIRGRNSLNSGTQPLYVIDGVPMAAGSWGIRADEGQTFSPLSSLNPDDIASITVLKDATATSIYGARAANGVIVITTKQAKAGAKTKVSLDVKTGWEEMPSFTNRYKVVNADQYNELQVEGWKNYFNDGVTDPSKLMTTEEASNRYYNGSIYGYSLPEQGITKDNMANVNWLDQVTRKGLVENYNLSVQSAGQSPKSPRYFLSLGYMKDKAIIVGKDFKRYSVRLNLDQNPTNWLTFGMNTSLSYTETNMGAGGGYFSDPITQAYMQSPLTPVKDQNGDWNFNTVNGYNPVAQRSALGDKSRNQNYRALISPYLTIKFMPELSYTSRLGVDYMHMNEFGYWSFLQPQGKDMRGMGENSTNDQSVITLTNTLNYIKTLNGGHNINLMLGQETSSTNLNTTYLSGSNYPVPDKNVASLAATPGSASTDKYELRLASFFFNGEYDYNDKYYLSGSYRVDGSSRFGSNNRWAGFWSVGAKYRITQEDFMSSTSGWLNSLTIRSSYGTSGNQAVGLDPNSTTIYNGWYASRPLWGYGYNYNSNGGSSPEQVGNPDLKWEQTAKFNVGLDATLWSMFDITFDYYHHETQHMVFAMPLSMTSGYSSVPKNIGKLKNTGFELSLTANIIRRKDLKWSATFVGATNKNRIEKLSTDNPIESTYTIIEPGHDIYQFKMKEFAGVDAQTGAPLYYLNETGDKTTTDYNAAAKRYVGKASPDYQGSFSTALKFKGFDFSVQMNYALGGKIYGSNLRYDEQRGGGLNQAMTRYVYDNRWQQPGDIAKVPKFEMTESNYHSSQFLMNGDYLKIENVVLGYTFPRTLVKNLQNLRVYVTANNLYTFTASDYRGFDPASVGANGIQWWNYPTPRTFMAGLSVNF